MTPERLERARQILAQVHHPAIATVNVDGSPLNTPVFGVFNAQLHLFWSSAPDSTHSQNIRRDGQVFVVVFDSRQGHGGVYMAAQAQELNDTRHINYAYALLRASNPKMGSVERSMGNGPQRLYRAIPNKFWVNVSTKDEEGYVIRDQRLEVSLGDLL